MSTRTGAALAVSIGATLFAAGYAQDGGTRAQSPSAGVTSGAPVSFDVPPGWRKRVISASPDVKNWGIEPQSGSRVVAVRWHRGAPGPQAGTPKGAMRSLETALEDQLGGVVRSRRVSTMRVGGVRAVVGTFAVSKSTRSRAVYWHRGAFMVRPGKDYTGVSAGVERERDRRATFAALRHVLASWSWGG